MSIRVGIIGDEIDARAIVAVDRFLAPTLPLPLAGLLRQLDDDSLRASHVERHVHSSPPNDTCACDASRLGAVQ
jgi:hypothetical protein